MRDPTRRELFLQNRLAVASTLIYDLSQLISGKPGYSISSLQVECETFFSETRISLLAEIAEEEKAESRTSAPSAEASGAVWKSAGWTGWQQTSPAEVAKEANLSPPLPPEESPEVSSNPSSGGMTSTQELSRDKLISQIKASLNMRPRL